MKRIFFALLYAIPGYFLGAFIGYYLISTFSLNVHDRDLEAAMTGAFLTGPLVALLALGFGAARGRKKNS